MRSVPAGEPVSRKETSPLFRDVTDAQLQPGTDGTGFYKSSALLPRAAADDDHGLHEQAHRHLPGRDLRRLNKDDAGVTPG